MKFEIEGKVLIVFETKHVSASFSKREFVIETEDGKYSQTLLFEATGKAIDVLDGLNDGDTVKVHFNLRGREWHSPKGETKYFNSLSAWKVEQLDEKSATSSQADSAHGQQSAQPSLPTTGVDDDIPF